MCRGRRTRIQLHLHIQSDGTALRGSWSAFWLQKPVLQTHCQRGRPQDFVAGTRVTRSGLTRVFVHALAYISMQMLGGRCSCTRSVRSTQPAADQHSPRVRQLFDLSTSKCKRDTLCNWGALPPQRQTPACPAADRSLRRPLPTSPCRRPRHRPGCGSQARPSPTHHRSPAFRLPCSPWPLVLKLVSREMV
jgi:hypothetical protein